MSKSQELKKVIWDVLDDGEIHTSAEIQQACIEKGLVDVEHVGKIRGIIFNMKNEHEEFEVVSRGKYKINLTKDKQHILNEEKSLDYSIAIIKEKLLELKQINWITASDESLQNARQDAAKLKALEKEISKVVNG